MKSKKYLLKNKDKVVLEFEVDIVEIYSNVSNKIEFTHKINNICSIEADLLPRNLRVDDLENNLDIWIRDRKIPRNRQFVENIVATYSVGGKDMLMDYIDISFGLSLNDSYWIVSNDKEYKWKDYNLYDNEFSEALQRASFGEELLKIRGFTSSPEYTTNGMLKKCWHRDNGKIYLYKGSSKEYANGGKEAYSEYYMAQVAEVMGFDCIPYDLKEFHGEIVSTCQIFTNENEGYVPIYQIFQNNNWKNLQRAELVNYIAEYYPIEKLQDILLFDALIMNKDRHLGNFGMIIDNNTNQTLRSAPIFDNGYSILNFLTLDDLQDINNSKTEKVSYFSYLFDEQLKLFIQPRHRDNLQKLESFTFKRHPQYNLSEEWLSPLEAFLQKRATLALSFLEKNTSEVFINPNDSTALESIKKNGLI